jgi:hypothetical protein
MAKVTHIEGRRWFERTNSNTYHSTTVYYSDGTSKKEPYNYGYDDQYLQTAFIMMGVPYGGTRKLRDWGVTHSVVDVGRKRDL